MNRMSFEEWYESGLGVFVDFDEMPTLAEFKEMQIGLRYGIYQRYFQLIYGWLIYTKPDYDKFSIHIESGLEKKTIYNNWLINNNLNSVQQILVDKAFEKAKELE
jgi:hypothetical protein